MVVTYEVYRGEYEESLGEFEVPYLSILSQLLPPLARDG